MDDVVDDGELRVFCLCAAWCGVCRDYRGVVDAAAASGTARFDWVDIEDEAALLDDIDVEDFPTLLIARGDRTLFFGTVTPQPATLARLVQRAADGELAPLAVAPGVAALAGRLGAARA
ncbi:MAG TPA: thioredoxin family protein [Burkholderiaceae bacterium]|nr:thioredoxin family protein [Burkholderiaceae bacterium]